jgi:Rieske Fe-S protein
MDSSLARSSPISSRPGRTRGAEVYDPHRLRLRAVGDLVQENANVLTKLGRWLAPGDVRDERAIPRGSGAVVWRGFHKAAVYRDASGRTHAVSASCPHLGCLVSWNPAEATWDCPCHGSRFDPLGRVLNGPANRGLASLEMKRA